MLGLIDNFTTVVFIVVTLWAVFKWITGILPALLRLGNGLAKREIAIFAKTDNFSSLKDMLLDSKLFSSKNIIQVSTEGDFKKASKLTLFLVYWPDWADTLNKIIKLKNDRDAIVIYAPQDKGFLPKEQMSMLNNERNAIVTNMRGRLMNDIVVSMMTTGYKK